ncbi:MAG: hypothetical protein ACR2LX_09795 [Jatrophihabitans sp.]
MTISDSPGTGQPDTNDVLSDTAAALRPAAQRPSGPAAQRRTLNPGMASAAQQYR